MVSPRWGQLPQRGLAYLAGKTIPFSHHLVEDSGRLDKLISRDAVLSDYCLVARVLGLYAEECITQFVYLASLTPPSISGKLTNRCDSFWVHGVTPPRAQSPPTASAP